jgi:endonuclease/exonuclease/phosphatase family metal-dependent hydrolase
MFRSFWTSSRRPLAAALVALWAVTALAGCAKKSGDDLTGPPPGTHTSDLFPDLHFGTASSFEVVTWNIQNFPRSSYTISYLAQALRSIDADVVCLQEIESGSGFDALVDSLDGYVGYRGSGAAYDINLAILYKAASFSAVQIDELFPGEHRPFPRSPIQFSATFDAQHVVVIDNHYKASGDGRIDTTDPYDEEARRAEASALLDDYIRTTWPDDRVIVVGDLNDRLTDAAPNNVFQVFLDLPGEYRFADMALAEGPSSNFSWIGGNPPSHLDHILVTNELFSAVSASGAVVTTLKPEADLQEGITEYRDRLSDHRPVAMRIGL